MRRSRCDVRPLLAASAILGILASARVAAPAAVVAPDAPGFQGVWYSTAGGGDYPNKYGGGLATYPQQVAPLAIYSPAQDKTYFTFSLNLPKPGRPINVAHVMSYFDHATRQLARPKVWLDKNTTDAHDAPILAIDGAGYIYMFSNTHGESDRAYVRRSAHPYDIRSYVDLVGENPADLRVFGNPVPAPDPDDADKRPRFAYGNLWYVPDAVDDHGVADPHKLLFLHTRYNAGSQRDLFSTTSGDGDTWTPRKAYAQIERGQYPDVLDEARRQDHRRDLRRSPDLVSRNRDFLIVDPADITVYTRKFRDPAEPDSHAAFVTRGQHANSHVKLVGNTFHDWHGMGIAVRNARNVEVRENLFLAPTEDKLIRQTLAADPAMSSGGVGRYAAIFMDSVGGARVTGNRVVGLPAGDGTFVRDQQVTDVVAADNAAGAAGGGPIVAFSFSEWFGTSGEERVGSGAARDTLALTGNVTHRAGRLGAGLTFDGKGGRATIPRSTDVGGKAMAQLTVGLWLCVGDDDATQVVYGQGDAQHGVVIVVEKGRLIGGVWEAGRGAWIDLGPAVPGVWRHVALAFDGGKSLRGYLDAAEVASVDRDVPARIELTGADGTFGGAVGSLRIGSDRALAAGSAAYVGAIDEFRMFDRVLDPSELWSLALRLPVGAR